MRKKLHMQFSEDDVQEMTPEGEKIVEIILAGLKANKNPSELEKHIKRGCEVLKRDNIIDQFKVEIIEKEQIGFVIFNTKANPTPMQITFPLSL
jgi:hypothetical protein